MTEHTTKVRSGARRLRLRPDRTLRQAGEQLGVMTGFSFARAHVVERYGS
ncbi:hypothetical protein [Streptomyces sp. rh34]|nr:hypothetical protein [Streptomyces sp. rh34]